jgi:hypothetical protein
MFAHNALISGPIDSKPSANERELNREASDLFCSNGRLQLLGAASSVKPTWLVAKVTDSTINRTPCIALAKPVEINITFVFHPFLEMTP